MKKKIVAVLLCVLSVLTTACGSDTTGQAMQETSNDTVVDNEQEIVEAFDSGESESEAVVEIEEVTWVPQEFEWNGSETLTYTVPAVHTEANEQCNFLWTVTEDDLLNWFMGKYGQYEATKSVSVYNTTGYNNFDSRSVHVTRADGDANVYNNIEVETTGYNEKYPSRISLELNSGDLDSLIADMTEFIGLLNLGEYTEDILHNAGLELVTENGLGDYSISGTYSTNEYDQSYRFSLYMYYKDYEYTENVFTYTPEKMEYFENEYKLSEMIPNSEFDTTSVGTFQTDVLDFIHSNFDKTIQELGNYQVFNYKQEDFESAKEITRVAFGTSYEGDSMTNGYSSTFEYEGDSIYFSIPCNFAYDYNFSVTGRDISESEIQRLCETRYAFLKKLDNTLNCTLDDMIKMYRVAEFEESYEMPNYETNSGRCNVYNDFLSLTLSYRK